MKVLFLSRRFYPDIGGVEKHVLEISKLLVKDGHKVTVVTQSIGKEKNIEGLKIIRIPQISKNSSEKLHIWKWFWKNRELIKKSDLVHAHDVYWWYWPYRFIFLNKKSFITFHGYESYPIKKTAIIVRRISAYLTNGNIAVGDFIQKWYGTKPDFVTYGGVGSIKRSKTKVIPNKAIFIGRLDEDTGILDYIEIEKMMKKMYKSFQLFVIGEGKYASLINSKNRKNFTTSYRKELESSEFVFSSSYLMMLEALSLGKPIFSIYKNDLKKDYLRLSPFKDFVFIASSKEVLSQQIIGYIQNKKSTVDMLEKGKKWSNENNWYYLRNKYYYIWGIK